MRTDFDINPLCSSSFQPEDTSYGNSRFDEGKNRYILEATITYIKGSERFSEVLIFLEKEKIVNLFFFKTLQS